MDKPTTPTDSLLVLVSENGNNWKTALDFLLRKEVQSVYFLYFSEPTAPDDLAKASRPGRFSSLLLPITTEPPFLPEPACFDYLESVVNRSDGQPVRFILSGNPDLTESVREYLLFLGVPAEAIRNLSS